MSDGKIIQKGTSDDNRSHLVIDDLNNSFYENFDPDYFVQKVDYLLVLLSDLDYVDAKLKAGIQYGQIKGNGHLSEDEKEKLRKNLRTEIALTYYHSIETLFRLFLAHAKETDCPWVEITSLVSFKKFKRQINEKIIKQRLDFDGKDFKQSLILLFFGSDLSAETDTEKWNKNLRNLEALLAHFAKSLLETPHYNSYKHGLAIFQSQLGFQFSDLMSVDKQDTLVILEIKGDKASKYLSKTHHFLKWEEKFVQTHIVTRLIKNLVAVGKSRFCGRQENVWVNFFDDCELNKIISTKNGISVDSISVSL